MAVALDTHAVIWYLSESDLLSPAALNAIEDAVSSGEDVFLSAISLVEVIYLAEKGKLRPDAVTQLQSALRETDAGIIVVPLDSAVAASVPRIFPRRNPRHARPNHRGYRGVSWCASGYP